MASDLLKLVKLSRLFDAVYPLVSLFLGAAVVGGLHNPVLFILVFIVVILNSVAMIWNDIEDKHIDAANGRPELLETSISSLNRLKIYIVILVSIALLLAWVVTITVFTLAIVTVCVIWVYNSKPFQASRRPIMSIVILSGAGAFLPYLFGLSLGVIESHSIIAGLLWWIGRISLSILKDYKDVQGDARHGKRTFLLCYGRGKVAVTSIVTLSIGYIGFVALMYSHSSTVWLLPVLIGAVGIFAYMRHSLFSATATHAQFDAVFRKIAQYQLLLDAGIVLWLI